MFLTRPRKSVGARRRRARRRHARAASAIWRSTSSCAGGCPTRTRRRSCRRGSSAPSAAGSRRVVIAVIVAPLFERALGEMPRGKLVELTDLNHPLLKRIAEKAPGTWAHSLVMANMAEIAATAIGANGRLDARRRLLPRPRQVVCAEVLHREPARRASRRRTTRSTRGVGGRDLRARHRGRRLGRAAGMPERIIDFMHMHHGNGVLEYFWHKNEQHGNPKRPVGEGVPLSGAAAADEGDRDPRDLRRGRGGVAHAQVTDGARSRRRWCSASSSASCTSGSSTSRG